MRENLGTKAMQMSNEIWEFRRKVSHDKSKSGLENAHFCRGISPRDFAIYYSSRRIWMFLLEVPCAGKIFGCLRR